MKYDVVFGPQIGQADVQPHFCREWDGGEGCYGTNPDHGYTWDEARAEVVKYYEQMVASWRCAGEPTDKPTEQF